MLLRIFYCVVFLLGMTGAVRAQSSSTDPPPTSQVDQSEALLDTLKRMQIKREEGEHKKLLEKAVSIKEGAELMARELAAGRLSRTHEKRLREMEKFARQIRSESGGSADEKLDSPPATLKDSVSLLVEAGERLNATLAKTSRRVVSVAVVDASCEVIELIKLIRLQLE